MTTRAVTTGDIMRAWFRIARIRAAKGDRVGAEQARVCARSYRNRGKTANPKP